MAIHAVSGFGASVRTIRKIREMSLAELGTAVGLSNHEISKLELEQRQPALATAMLIAKALNVPLTRLVGDARVELNRNRRPRQRAS